MRKSGGYDFIAVDVNITFDKNKATLFNIADKVVIITQQNVLATNILVSNINRANSDKYTFVCNDFDKDKDNALISPNVALKFSISDYVDLFANHENMRPYSLSRENSIQRTEFLII